MSKLTKNQKIAYAKVEAAKAYKLSEAAALLKEITFTKFDASVDIDVRLGVDPRKANQMVRDDRTLQTQLTGNARIRRLVGSTVADEVIGHRITYNELTETYSVTGGASTATGSANAVPSGRVRATIVPLNQSGSRR